MEQLALTVVQKSRFLTEIKPTIVGFFLSIYNHLLKPQALQVGLKKPVNMAFLFYLYFLNRFGNTTKCELTNVLR